MPILANRPTYEPQPISSIKTLARVLNVDVSTLIDIANNSEAYWKPGKKQKKKDGDVRITNDARDPLKQIHFRIKERILAKVLYPSYILGGIASDQYTHRDYIEHANVHSNSHILLSEDIENFFPSTKTAVIRDIWRGLFEFHPDVSDMLTTLTIYEDSLPQGWITSNHLANLALWRHEADFVTSFETSNYHYSRFVDDISISSKNKIDKELKTKLVSDVFRLIRKCGFEPKRSKHDLSTSGHQMRAVGLNVNGKNASKPKDSRRKTRALVNQCVNYNPCARNSPIYIKMWDKASGEVGTLKQLHPAQAKVMRELLSSNRPIRPPRKSVAKKKSYRKSLPLFSD